MDAKLAGALERMETIEQLDARAVRDQLCDALAELDHASTTFHYRAVVTRDGPRVLGTTVRAPKDIAAMCHDFARSYERVYGEMSQVSAAYDPGKLRPIETRAFVEFHKLVPDEVLWRTKFFKVFLERGKIVTSNACSSSTTAR